MEWQTAKALESEVTSESDVFSAFEDLTNVLERQELGVRGVKRDYLEIKLRNTILPKLIPELVKRAARWRYINSGFQFRFQDNAILCWWPRTGSCIWLGSQRSDLDVFQEIVLKPESAFQDVDHVVPTLACLVCGEKNIEVSCSACSRIQTDLCSTCFLLAHWCS